MRVTFELPADAAQESASVVGDFNGWDPESHPMKLNRKDGVWRRGVSFKPGETIEFRYVLDGNEWRNDEEADRYVGNSEGSENSVLEL